MATDRRRSVDGRWPTWATPAAAATATRMPSDPKPRLSAAPSFQVASKGAQPSVWASSPRPMKRSTAGNHAKAAPTSAPISPRPSGTAMPTQSRHPGPPHRGCSAPISHPSSYAVPHLGCPPHQFPPQFVCRATPGRSPPHFPTQFSCPVQRKAQPPGPVLASPPQPTARRPGNCLPTRPRTLARKLPNSIAL